MLSICIPIYNFNVIDLIEKLHAQLLKIDKPCEIICIDDCSDKQFEEKNNETCNKFSRYIVLQKNIGRAKIRNLFLNYAKYDYLLFLDCDSKLISDNFLLKYSEAIVNNYCQVICGGRIYNETKPPGSLHLRWKYGRFTESKPFKTRQINPYKSFMTNNFVVDRKVLENIKFNEELVYYGHEDTLFGFQLLKNKIIIKHIDNPVLNGNLECNREYLNKTELGLKNLVNILQLLNCDPAFINEVKILKVYFKLQKKHLLWLIALIFALLKPLIKFLLANGIANLILFDFYKLGFLQKHLNFQAK